METSKDKPDFKAVFKKKVADETLVAYRFPGPSQPIGYIPKGPMRKQAAAHVRLFTTMCRQEGVIRSMFSNTGASTEPTDNDIIICPLTGELRVNMMASLTWYKYSGPTLSGFTPYQIAAPVELAVYIEKYGIWPGTTALGEEATGVIEYESPIMASIGEIAHYWKRHEWQFLKENPVTNGFSHWIPEAFLKIIGGDKAHYFLEGFVFDAPDGTFPHLRFVVLEEGQGRLTKLIDIIRKFQVIIEERFPSHVASVELDPCFTLHMKETDTNVSIQVGGKRYLWEHFVWSEELVTLMELFSVTPSPHFMHRIMEAYIKMSGTAPPKNPEEA